MNELQRRDNETEGEFEARRLMERIRARNVVREALVARLMQVVAANIGDPEVRALMLDMRAADSSVKESLDALNRMLREAR